MHLLEHGPGDHRPAYGPADVALAAASEFDALRTLDQALGRWAPPDGAGADAGLLARTAELGGAHERRELDRLTALHGDALVRLDRPAPTAAALRQAHRRTLDALRAGAPAVHQGTLFDGRLTARCDFLVRDPGTGAYTVCDARLARHARVTALVQLAAHADQLLREGVPVSPTARLLLGDGTASEHRLADLLPFYRHHRRRLDALVAGHLAQPGPVRWGDPRYTADPRSDLAAPDVAAARDPILVAGMSTQARSRLAQAGVTTVDAVAALDPARPVPGLAAPTLARLRDQAAAQLAQERTGPYAHVHTPSALAALPAPDPGDLFFDFEGDPLWADRADHADWGLEYLFGVVEAPSADTGLDPATPTVYRAFWAHDRAQERRALTDFLDYVAARRAAHPGMRIYHYAAYERSALLRLAGRHGVGEAAVDDLLRHGVLVDLYPLVRRAVLCGATSYSIKKLEPHYMGARLRAGEVTTAGDSLVQYARFLGLRAEGRGDEAAAVLDSVADYNRHDCDSTLHLRNWLARLAAARGVPLAPAAPAALTADPPDAGELQPGAVERALLERAGPPGPGRDPAAQAAALYAAACGYHERERKPFWWAHFERLAMTGEDLAATAAAFVPDAVEVLADWARPRGHSTAKRYLALRGDPPPGGDFRPGASVHALYEDPAPAHAGTAGPGTRGAAPAALLTGEAAAKLGLAGPPGALLLAEAAGRGADPHRPLPAALAPGAPPNAALLAAAAQGQGAAALAAFPAPLAAATDDLLRRAAPRTRSGAPPPPAPPGAAAEAITAALLDLDGSYIAVQGPPGTGKTHTGSQVVAVLALRHGWRVGVVAQSHSVVENMLDGVVGAGVPAARVVKKDNRIGSGKWTVLRDNKGYAAALAEPGGLVCGGTAWTFANPATFPAGSLDLLVVDEAGQFSLANTLAVGACARNLLLLGDPRQLPQVSVGTHPEPVDQSALGWLLGGRGTIDPARGYFLDTTYRMHPALCRAVSELSYESRLLAHPDAAGRDLAGVAPGVRTVFVDHQGNSTSSPEEAEEVTRQVQSLLGTPWRPAPGAPHRPLGQGDVIVTAPYNAQVHLLSDRLAAAGLDGVRVGTVDKFQGRQAAVAVVSLAASAVEDTPRGMGFLLSRNRLNVALSRGQWLAVVVRSRALTRYLPTTPAGLEELGAFMGLTGEGEGFAHQ